MIYYSSRIILPLLLAGFAFYKKALTPAADALAFVLAIIICFCGGIWQFAQLAAVFAFTIAAGKISAAKREKIEKSLHKKKGPRDTVQIICNVLTGAAMLVVYTATSNLVFIAAFSGAMAASLSDSLASELGILSRSAPRSILTLRPVSAGMSGGVSPLGFACSLLGALIIGILAAIPEGSFSMLAAVTIGGFAASIADSILGASIQAKYKCPICGMVTEKPRHCSCSGVISGGFKFISNDTVNLLNNLCGAAVSGLLFYFIGQVI